MTRPLLLALSFAASAVLAQDVPQPTVAAQLTEMLARAAGGHSPNADEVQAVETEAGLTDPAVATQMVPLLTRALADPDVALRKYALAMLVGMQSLPDPAPDAVPVPPAEGAPNPSPPAVSAKASAPQIATPAQYKGEVAKALAPLISAIGARLADDDPDNRALAVTDLGGFAPDPPASVLTPLLAYLRRDDAPGPIGLAAVADLLQFARVSDDTASAIAKYLRRTDQTASGRTELVEAIASKATQSRAVNKALLSYLDSDDPGLRARVILSLPQLDLTPDVFAEMKVRVADIASGGQENLPVVNAAKSVAPCWTSTKMTSGCPVY